MMRLDFESFEALTKDGDIGPFVRDWYPEFANQLRRFLRPFKADP